MTPLALFSGPYAILARLGVVTLVFLSAMAYGAWKMHAHDSIKYESLKYEYNTFKAEVGTLGRVAQAAADQKKASDLAKKKEIDDAHAKAVAALAATVSGLRRANDARSRELPAPTPSSSRPDLLCLDRAEYQRAYGELFEQFQAGIRRLADEGTASTLSLDAAKKWGQKP
jgi:hypothetical protein